MTAQMTESQFETAVGKPLRSFALQCHAASVALVRSGVLGESRVARGTVEGVPGQHSWVVLGMDCYAPDAVIVDPTLWSYRDDVVGVWSGPPSAYSHRPHGWGSIWEWGNPNAGSGEPIMLDVEGLSCFAQTFLGLVGPLSLEGWRSLFNAPVGGWPAAEIVDAAADHPQLRALIPVDRVGMLTDRNPGGLYLPVRNEGEQHG